MKDKEKVLDFQFQPVQTYQNYSLDKKYRGQLAFRLERGGKDEAVKMYDQIHKDNLYKKWHLKVCIIHN